MNIRMNTIIAIMITFCFTATLFMVIPIKSATSPYDPWIDYNDDGKISLQDLVMLANSYGTTGDPINKTALLLDLEDRVDALNSSLLSLQDYFNTRITTLEATVGEQQVRIADLEIELAVLNASGRALIAEAHINSGAGVPISSTSWVDMPNMYVTLPPEAAQRPSNLLITFTTQGWCDNMQAIWVRAMVSGPSIPWTPANVPSNLLVVSQGAGEEVTQTFFINASTTPYDSVKLQWYISGGQGGIAWRLMTVIAFLA